MMGQHEEQSPLFSYDVVLEHRIRADHPLRAVRERIDFSFARAVVAASYGRNGHVGLDPEIILKLMFLLFFDDIPSERELMARLPERLDYLWFLGYSLNDPIPHHSVLSKARKRWGAAVFEELFVRTVEQCVAAGLVEGSKLHIDATLVDANASRDSVVTGPPELIAQLRALSWREGGKLTTSTRVGRSEPSSCPIEPASDSPDESKEDDFQGGSGLPASSSPSSSSPAASLSLPPTGDAPVSTKVKATGKHPPPRVSYFCRTDPDAPLTGRRGHGSRPRYKHHRAIDNHRGVITALLTTGGTAAEANYLPLLTEQHQRHTGRRIKTAIGDCSYGTSENMRWCQQHKVRCHLGDLKRAQGSHAARHGFFLDGDFVYDAARDEYACPAGAALRRQKFRPELAAWTYKAEAQVCAGCALRAACTNAKHGRTLLRHDDKAIALARAQSHSRAATRDRKRRRHLMERSFADGANNHGLKRARWRGLDKQRIQQALIAAAQNIRLLMRRTGKAGRQARAHEVRTGISFLLLGLHSPLRVWGRSWGPLTLI